MRVDLIEMWATPSTLHLRLGVWGKNDRWVQFHWVDVPIVEILDELSDQPLDVIPPVVGEDQPLPGMPYSV